MRFSSSTAFARKPKRMGTIMDWMELLSEVRTILVIDWRSQDVPEALARKGLHVLCAVVQAQKIIHFTKLTAPAR